MDQERRILKATRPKAETVEELAAKVDELEEEVRNLRTQLEERNKDKENLEKKLQERRHRSSVSIGPENSTIASSPVDHTQEETRETHQPSSINLEKEEVFSVATKTTTLATPEDSNLMKKHEPKVAVYQVLQKEKNLEDDIKLIKQVVGKVLEGKDNFDLKHHNQDYDGAFLAQAIAKGTTILKKYVKLVNKKTNAEAQKDANRLITRFHIPDFIAGIRAELDKRNDCSLSFKNACTHHAYAYGLQRLNNKVKINPVETAYLANFKQEAGPQRTIMREFFDPNDLQDKPDQREITVTQLVMDLILLLLADKNWDIVSNLKKTDASRKLTRHDLQKWLYNDWTTGLVINKYFHLMQRRSWTCPDLPKVWYLDTRITHYSALMGEEYLPSPAKLLKLENEKTKNGYSFIKADLCFLPILENKNHWTLLCFNMKTLAVKYYNSWHCKKEDERVKDKLKNIVKLFNRIGQTCMGRNYADFSTSDIEICRDLPQEKGTADSGIYIMRFAEMLSREVDISNILFAEDKIQFWRKFILHELVQDRLFHEKSVDCNKTVVGEYTPVYDENVFGVKCLDFEYKLLRETMDPDNRGRIEELLKQRVKYHQSF